jgi:two-component system, NarL family, sensor kinase
LQRERNSTQPPELSGPAAAADDLTPGGVEDLVRRVAEITVQNERLLRRLVADEKRFRGLAKAVWKVQEDERRRLALELHDGIGQTLTALINHLRRAREEMAGETGVERLDQGIELAELALEDVRELSRLLRPAVLDDLGLHAGLSWLIRILRERAGLETAMDWRLEEGRTLDADVETLVFRIVQEGLNNVVKHSGQGRAKVSIGSGAGRLELEISDAGRGFDPAVALARPGEAGLGLRGIRDRIELFGGRFAVDSSPGGGSRLRVAIPLGDVQP